jgi:hypothetical protein
MAGGSRLGLGKKRSPLLTFPGPGMGWFGDGVDTTPGHNSNLSGEAFPLTATIAKIGQRQLSVLPPINDDVPA